MKITFQGFRLYAGDGIALSEFGKILIGSSSADREHAFNDHNRLFLFEGGVHEDFYTGLLITAKDQRSFPELRNEQGRISIKVSELAEGSRLMDFNFFVLHKTTFCGVYQHYHASCSPAQFGVFLRQFFWRPERETRKELRKRQLMETGVAEERAEAKALKAFKKNMRFDLYYKPDDYEVILRSMKEIKTFQFDISTKVSHQSTFSPGVSLKRKQQTIAFTNSNWVDRIAPAIRDYVRTNHVERGKVMAIDPQGEQRPIYLKRNIEGFGEFDFDEVTAEIALDDLAGQFANSPVVANLLAAARLNSALFCEPDDE